jgi:hypothetical protein
MIREQTSGPRLAREALQPRGICIRELGPVQGFSSGAVRDAVRLRDPVKMELYTIPKPTRGVAWQRPHRSRLEIFIRLSGRGAR